ncbi:MAG: phosphoglucosamine mutase [Proteobacteria bacterium]|nr:MAG: phosphoglucosamine mutase [Pseudomonadota bacterium]
MKRLFGTDGVRGMANQFPMTGEMAMALGRAVAHTLQTNPSLHGKTSLPVGIRPLEGDARSRRVKIVVGKDTRLSGYMIENAFTAGVLSMGADVILIGPLSTPGVAYLTHSIRADAGIMISASHNAFHDNGIKIFSSDGYKLPDQLEDEIERLTVGDSIAELRPTGDLVGKAYRIDDVHYRYVVYLKGLFARDLDLIGLRVALDCAHGAAYKTAPLVLEELGAEVLKSGVSPNGLNINHLCGALHPGHISKQVIKYRADVGIALDGDGDRCIMSDENGEIVDGDQIIGLCALSMHEEGILEKDTIVTTPMSNIGLEQSLKKKGISMLRAKVGDRYVVEMMRKQGISLGGEQSGHIVFLNASTTGDGILAALKILEIMKRTGKKLSELKEQITLFPQVREDVKIKRRVPLEDLPKVTRLIEATEKKLRGKGRVFVRFSGTENLCRVMLEGEDIDKISGYAKIIADAIRKELT